MTRPPAGLGITGLGVPGLEVPGLEVPGLEVTVRGGATAEEIAAVLEVLLVRRRGLTGGLVSDSGADRYERWRRGRLAALRADQTEDC
jgi:hypothetical protein